MTSRFRQSVQKAITDRHLQVALDRNAEKKKSTRAEVNASFPHVDHLRQQAKRIRSITLNDLERHLKRFTQQIEANGFIVHHAQDAQEARQIVINLILDQRAEHIVKSKTMLSEEIHLNQALEQIGVQVVETDLGEFIVQLRGEPPSHIVAPAIHLRREDVGKTFQEKLGTPYTDDAELMNKIAREALRTKFISADVGISGVNFGVAETGSICIVTNEGNGRMVTTLPRMHIALMGVERLVPTLKDLEIMLRLLPRFATGQKLTSYISLIQGPRGQHDPDGPQERHLILIDNGRQELRGTALEEALLCIRCGSCLDFCPVFREIGGYPYESVYPGPIGSVISPGLFGLDLHGHLAYASTLCGACQDACPIDIDLPGMLLRVRKDYVEGVPQPQSKAWMIRAWRWVMQTPGRFELAQSLASLGGKLLPKMDGWGTWLPAPLSGWTKSRHFPPFNSVPFRMRFKTIDQKPGHKGDTGSWKLSSDPRQPEPSQSDLTYQFAQTIQELGGEFVRCHRDEVGRLVLATLGENDCDRVLVWEGNEEHILQLRRELLQGGITLVDPFIPPDHPGSRKARVEELAELRIGITGAMAGFADTGTLVLPSGQGMSQLASLLPSTHVAILPANRIHQSMSAWLMEGGEEVLRESQSVALVSGPSRTADIEMTLSIGVHGPGQVIVFCVE